MTDPFPQLGRDPFVSAVSDRLRTRCGIPVGAGVLLACSGGADSTALLLCLHVLRRRADVAIEPMVVHVNHHLREGADDDAAFVAGLGGRLGVPCVVRDVRPADAPGNLEAAGRRLRYETLRETAEQQAIDWIITAHQAEDQLECLLMSLGRGGGLEGLGGMAWSGPVPGDAGPSSRRLARPMLDLPRAEAERFCGVAGVTWREDPTNLDTTRTRARLRADVLPVLESLWPGAATRAAGTADLVRAAAAGQDGVLAAVFGPPSARQWPRDRLACLPTPLIAAGLRRAATHAIGGGSSDRLGQRPLTAAAEAITSGNRVPRRFDWPHGLVVSVTSGTVSLDQE